MNKLLKFYWKKEKQMLILQIRFYFLLIVSFSFSFSFFFFFFFFHFFIFFHFFFKAGTTPLFYSCWKWIWRNCWNVIERRRSRFYYFKIGLFFNFFFFLFCLFFFLKKNSRMEKTPLSIAVQKGHLEIVQTLKIFNINLIENWPSSF